MLLRSFRMFLRSLQSGIVRMLLRSLQPGSCSARCVGKNVPRSCVGNEGCKGFEIVDTDARSLLLSIVVEIVQVTEWWKVVGRKVSCLQGCVGGRCRLASSSMRGARVLIRFWFHLGLVGCVVIFWGFPDWRQSGSIRGTEHSAI